MTTAQQATLQTGTWGIDPTHSVISLSIRHLVAAKVRGTFRSFSGTIEIGDTAETSSVAVSIDAAGVDTGVEDRDGHLRSPDFLDVENHPQIEFASTGVRAVSGGYEVDGSLTIRGVRNPVMLAMSYLGLVTDPWGNEKALFTATARVDREQWGLTWNQALEAGGFLVGKTIEVELEIQAVKAG